MRSNWQKQHYKCSPLEDGVVKQNGGKIDIIIMQKNMQDGKVTSRGGSSAATPESMLVSAWTEVASSLSLADVSGGLSKIKYVVDFSFTGRVAEERRRGYHALLQFAASRINVNVPPYNVEDYKTRLYAELLKMKGKISPFELPKHVSFKNGTGDVRGNEVDTSLYNVKKALDSAPFEVTLNNLSYGLYIETSVECGIGNRYKKGSWFKITKIRPNALVLKGPANNLSEEEINSKKETKLHLESFIVVDPPTDESPPFEEYQG